MGERGNRMAVVKTVVKTTGFIGPSTSSDPIEIDIDENGKAIRSRPLTYSDYATEDLNEWTITAKGKSFSAPKKIFPWHFRSYLETTRRFTKSHLISNETYRLGSSRRVQHPKSRH